MTESGTEFGDETRILQTRFVVLEHQRLQNGQPADHLDLMVESDGSFLTWAFEQWPQPGEKFGAKRLPNHRLEYWDYEGPLSQDRGHVLRLDRGTCRARQSDDGWDFFLCGDVYRGQLILRLDSALNASESFSVEWHLGKRVP